MPCTFSFTLVVSAIYFMIIKQKKPYRTIMHQPSTATGGARRIRLYNSLPSTPTRPPHTLSTHTLLYERPRASSRLGVIQASFAPPPPPPTAIRASRRWRPIRPCWPNSPARRRRPDPDGRYRQLQGGPAGAAFFMAPAPAPQNSNQFEFTGLSASGSHARLFFTWNRIDFSSGGAG